MQGPVTILFRKQIDNLKTNHRGTYVLTDNAFKPISRICLEKGRDTQVMMAQAQTVRMASGEQLPNSS